MSRGHEILTSSPYSVPCAVRKPMPTRQRRSQSLHSFSNAVEEAPPNGPLSGPSSVDWRRQRLLRIGNTVALGHPHLPRDNAGTEERTSLGNSSDHPGYGTIRPPLGSRSFSTVGHRNLPQLPSLPIPRGASSGPPTPTTRSPTSVRATLSRRLSLSQRRISAYDAPLVRSKSSGSDDDINVRINGFRVWYSSFSSIDWLHDAIKDSVRFTRLRHRKSLRSKLRLMFDKSLGWIIVTIVGFLTAVVAFLVVRSEQWFFDAKYGYCSTGWWKAKRFCCPNVHHLRSSDATCPDWMDWSSWVYRHTGAIENDYVEYISYTFIAVRACPICVYVCRIFITFQVLWATASCLLTIHLTASTSFTTRKDSGVLSPQFDNTNGKHPIPATKRQTLHYVRPRIRSVILTILGLPRLQEVVYRKSKRFFQVLIPLTCSRIDSIFMLCPGFVIHGYLGVRTLFTKSFGLALSVGSGLALGQFCPLFSLLFLH